MNLKTTVVVSCYGDSGIEWLERDFEHIIKIDKNKNNVGYNIFSYLEYIVNNYNSLPPIILFTKNNMLERHITPEEWEKIKDNETFTPILTQNHKVDGVTAYYKDGLYYERNDSWYLYSYERRYFDNYRDFATEFGLPNPPYLGFSPGACYIVPKENILKHDILYYEKLKSLVSWTQLCAEAHLIERSLVNIWS
jgi:hypothetical protein